MLEDDLNQTAVYWAPTGTDEYGQTTYATAIEVACRWEETSEQFMDIRGEVAISNAIVDVSVDLEPTGYLKLAKLAEISDLTNPRGTAKAFEIRRFEKTPDLDNPYEFWRTAYV